MHIFVQLLATNFPVIYILLKDRLDMRTFLWICWKTVQKNSALTIFCLWGQTFHHWRQSSTPALVQENRLSMILSDMWSKETDFNAMCLRSHSKHMLSHQEST